MKNLKPNQNFILALIVFVGIIVCNQAEAVYSADLDGNGAISLNELLRVIQFFNSDGLHCQAGTEDGFAPGLSPLPQDCVPHSSDYAPQDWQISLSELLRLIQLFNAGVYHACPEAGTEDGFCLGGTEGELGFFVEVQLIPEGADCQVSIEPNQATYPAGSQVTLSVVTCRDNFLYYSDHDSGDTCAESTVTLTVTRDLLIYAVFGIPSEGEGRPEGEGSVEGEGEGEGELVDLWVKSFPLGQGGFSLSPAAVDSLPNNGMKFEVGTDVTIQSFPQVGWQFDTWKGLEIESQYDDYESSFVWSSPFNPLSIHLSNLDTFMVAMLVPDVFSGGDYTLDYMLTSVGEYSWRYAPPGDSWPGAAGFTIIAPENPVYYASNGVRVTHLGGQNFAGIFVPDEVQLSDDGMMVWYGFSTTDPLLTLRSVAGDHNFLCKLDSTEPRIFITANVGSRYARARFIATLTQPPREGFDDSRPDVYPTAGEATVFVDTLYVLQEGKTFDTNTFNERFRYAAFSYTNFVQNVFNQDTGEWNTCTDAITLDDGSIDGGIGYGPNPEVTSAEFVQRFTLPVPYQVNSLCVAMGRNVPESPNPDLSCNIVFYSVEDNAPGVLLASIPALLTDVKDLSSPADNFFNVPVGITLNETEVFAGIQWNPFAAGGTFYVGEDWNPFTPYANAFRRSSNWDTWLLTTGGSLRALMIRLDGQEAWSDLVLDEFTFATPLTVGAEVTITAWGHYYGSQPLTSCIGLCSGYRNFEDFVFDGLPGIDHDMPLPPGGTFSIISTGHFTSAGVKQLLQKVDAADELAEIDEINNTIFATVQVNPASEGEGEIPEFPGISLTNPVPDPVTGILVIDFPGFDVVAHSNLWVRVRGLYDMADETGLNCPISPQLYPKLEAPLATSVEADLFQDDLGRDQARFLGYLIEITDGQPASVPVPFVFPFNGYPVDEAELGPALTGNIAIYEDGLPAYILNQLYDVGNCEGGVGR